MRGCVSSSRAASDPTRFTNSRGAASDSVHDIHMLRKITVHNFKSLQDVTVELDRISVFVGRSGSGKSNLINAVRFLRQLLLNRGVSFISNPAGWSTILYAAAHDLTLAFTVDFDLPSLPGGSQYHVRIGPPPGSRSSRSSRMGIDFQPTIIEESLTVAGRRIFAQAGGQWQVLPSTSQTVSAGQLGLGLFYGVAESQIAYSFLAHGIGCYDFPSDVLQTVNASDVELSLNDNGSNFIRVFKALSANVSENMPLREIMEAVRHLNPSVSTLELDLQQQNSIIVGHSLGPSGPFISLGLAQQSEGFRRFLAHLLALFQVPPKQTLFFEEPEKGVFPGALQTLAEFDQASHSQVILTTHNPSLLDFFPVDAIRVFELDGIATRIGPVAPEQVKAVQDELMRTGELLTVDPARIAESTAV